MQRTQRVLPSQMLTTLRVLKHVFEGSLFHVGSNLYQGVQSRMLHSRVSAHDLPYGSNISATFAIASSYLINNSLSRFSFIDIDRSQPGRCIPYTIA